MVGYLRDRGGPGRPRSGDGTGAQDQPRARPVPAILLARLAVDERHQGAGPGRSLRQDVLLRCVEAADATGARVLLVHANHDEAKAWYVRFAFEESPTDPLHLLMLLKDVRAFLERHGVG